MYTICETTFPILNNTTNLEEIKQIVEINEEFFELYNNFIEFLGEDVDFFFFMSNKVNFFNSITEFENTEIFKEFYNEDKELFLNLEMLLEENFSQQKKQLQYSTFESELEALGLVLYIQGCLYVVLVSILLLVALVGAVALFFNGNLKEPVENQSVTAQYSKTFQISYSS